MRKPRYRVAIFVVGILLLAVMFLLGRNSRTRSTLSKDTDILSAVSTENVHPIQFDAIQDKTEINGLVAHAFGMVDGESYTNSIEAFNVSYKQGFRLFEVDFMPLKDGNIITAHDLHEQNFGLTGAFTDYSKADLIGKKYNGKYTPLFAEEFIELLRKYPDIHVILDTKAGHTDIIRTLVRTAKGDPSVLDRLIPHVSNQENYDAVMAEYKFPQTMLALYRLLSLQKMSQEEIVGYIHKNNIAAVMINIKEDDATLANIGNDGPGKFSFRKFHELLNKERIPHYVHSAKTVEDVARFRDMGVGVYSDGAWLK